ncbi:pyrroline-5-carboxylate reductase [Sporosarcina trichiuri]|nr:pyrroline-5-carboxylate reductase [Sporosarcina sp. 0.2-SM1T-5]WJY28401.1 pyrroline-5-carboxylate reductase [Sporosarcina sp. 0.2-SM1T-5]
MKTIVFIGAGSMAEAVIAGICAKRTVEPSGIHVLNKSDDERLNYLKTEYGVSPVLKDRSVLTKADLIVLAVKPKDAESAMQEIASAIPSHAVVLSVLAGIPIAAIEAGLGVRGIARSMPNTSAAAGLSATGIAWNRQVTACQKEFILTLLRSFGMVAEVEEDDLHAVTALSGSGPAYVYYLAEALEEAAIQAGLKQRTARDLIIQTIEGAAAMLRQTAKEPAVLRNDVTSPGGTTAAGLQALDDHGFQAAVDACIRQAERRSRELGAGFGQPVSRS